MPTTYFSDVERLQSVEYRPCINYRDTYLRNREYGFRPRFGDRNNLLCEMYKSISPIAQWKNSTHLINNLDFSLDGRILGASCLWGPSLKSIFVLFDPLTQKQITSVTYEDFVGDKFIKFLDSRVFATYGSKISLWDIRYLKDKLRALNGPFKLNSLEYSAKDNLLVYGEENKLIKTWAFNRYSDDDTTVNKNLFRIDGLINMKLLPDSSKLVAATSYGCILLIKNLDLETPNKNIQVFHTAYNYASQMHKYPEKDFPEFTRKCNRVAFLVNFPGNIGTIYSIQIHPQSQNVLSQSISFDRQHQWICVHDIQDRAEDPLYKLMIIGSRLHWVPLNDEMHMMTNLTHYIEDLSPNLGGTQSCYSNDGRIICTPSRYGVRILSFSTACHPFSSFNPETPEKLFEIGTSNFHDDYVYCTKFSPVHPLLVSGGCDGRIVWYQPRL